MVKDLDEYERQYRAREDRLGITPKRSRRLQALERRRLGIPPTEMRVVTSEARLKQMENFLVEKHGYKTIEEIEAAERNLKAQQAKKTERWETGFKPFLVIVIGIGALIGLAWLFTSGALTP